MTITIADGRGALWQWDTGRKVKITDGDSVKQIHYQNRCFGRSVDVDVEDDGTAIIPDELLQDWHLLTAYAYVTDDAGGYTKVQVDFAVHKRARPSDYVYTPAEHAGFDRLRAEIGDLADLTTEAKDNLVAAINEAATSGGADWQQNDLDGDGYIKNRPGGYDVHEVRTIVDTTLVSADDDDNMSIAGADFLLAEGTPVYVSIDGAAEVTCTVAVTATEGPIMYSFGSRTYAEIAADGFSATDYIVAWYDTGGAIGRVYLNAAGADLVGKTIVARADIGTPVKIPEKYLELDSAKEILLFAISYNRSDDTYVSDRTYEELATALNAGKLVFAKFGNVGMGESYSYGLLYQAGMYVPVLRVSVSGAQPYLWSCTKGNEWTKEELLQLDYGYKTPKKAGTAAYGTSKRASRDDHVHPSELPDVSADDDGKLLGVTGGAWGKVDKPSGSDLSLGLTSAAVGQIAKITAVDSDGKPTAWEAVDMPSGGSGETWEKVAEVTTTEVVTSLRVTFDACKAVYVEYQWGGVEDSLGNIYIAPNVGDTFYTAESRAAAVKLTTSTNNKRGYTFVTIDTRMGSKWVAKSGTLSRGDGTFGDITPGDDMNCNIGAAGNCLFSKMSESYFDAGGKQLSDGVKSITAYGAGMAIGTTLSVWGIKK